MSISIDLHIKCPFYKKWNKKKTTIFYLRNFHIVFGEQIAILEHFFKVREQ